MVEDRRMREADTLITGNGASSPPSRPDQTNVRGMSVVIYFIWTLVTCLTHAVFDLNLATDYYRTSEWWNFGLTLAFWAIPHFFASVSSLLKYREKYKSTTLAASASPSEPSSPSIPSNDDFPSDSNCRFSFRFAFSFISPSATWHIDTYIYRTQAEAAELKEAAEGRHEEPNRPSQLLKREQKAAGEWTMFLHLVESFMKSAPQLVFQLFIIAKKETQLFSVLGSEVSWRTGIQIGSILSCLVSLAWSVTLFHTTISFKKHSILLFVSHLCIIGVRVVTLGLFASVFDGRDFWIVVLAHCVIISHIMRPQSHDVFVDNRNHQPLTNNWLSKWARKAWLAFLMDFTHMFTFVPFNESRSAHFRCTFAFYFVVSLIENAALLCSWAGTVAHIQNPFWHLVVISVPCSYLAGILGLVLYYAFVERLELQNRSVQS